MIHSRRDGVAEANACFVIPHFLQQNDVRIDRPKNIGRCRDPLRFYFRRRITSRTDREPFEIPGCDANLGRFRRFTECAGDDKEHEQSERGAIHKTASYQCMRSRGRFFGWQFLAASDSLIARR